MDHYSEVRYPGYAIEFIDLANVQACVRIAIDTEVRLIIEGTGHHSPRRST